MSWERMIKNQQSKDTSRREHSAARWALDCFRRDGDASRFPDLRWWLFRHSGYRYKSFSLDGFGLYDVEPRLTQEEYDRMKAAFLETEEGKVDSWGIGEW